MSNKESKTALTDSPIVKTAKIIAGAFILTTTLIGYGFHFSLMHELTFISNSLSGLLLLSDGIAGFTKKKALPPMLYQLVLPCILSVFSTVLFKLFGWFDFNFEGMFFFMHGINPLLILAAFLFATELRLTDKKAYLARIFTAPAPAICYALFDYIRFLITGRLVYGLVPTESLTLAVAALIGVLYYAAIALMSWGLLSLKLFVQKKMGSGKI